MPLAWAVRRAASLLRVEEGERSLDRFLKWTVHDSINTDSFFSPAFTRFSQGLALALAGHRQDSCLALVRVYELADAALSHGRDRETSFHPLHQKTMHYLLFACRWLLQDERRTDHLSSALTMLTEAEHRAVAEGLALGDDGYEEMALLHILLGNGSAALDVLRQASQGVALDPTSVTRGAPTRIKTLALAANHLVTPVAGTGDDIRERIYQGVAGIMKEEFGKASPDSPLILPWLDLPNVLLGRQGDPWAMLAQVNEMVGD